MRKTAIILFANLPGFEARAKSFSSFQSEKTTKRFSTILTQHFYQLAKQTSADTFLIDSSQQKGKTFGERITNAYQSIYAKGYQSVICIGNDCPSLNVAQIESAIQEVENGKVVLGPTFDGGAYLIGIPKKYFKAFDFQNIKWKTSQTYQDLWRFFNSNDAHIIETAIFNDIDNAKDLNQHPLENELISVLLSELKAFYPILTLYHIKEFLPTSHSKNLFFRGPPALAA